MSKRLTKEALSEASQLEKTTEEDIFKFMDEHKELMKDLEKLEENEKED
jgi:hypothetical protein